MKEGTTENAWGNRTLKFTDKRLLLSWTMPFMIICALIIIWSSCMPGSGSDSESAKTVPVFQDSAGLSKTPHMNAKGLPRLVDLGAGKCIPCKMMAPILEEIRLEYAGRLEVIFIDVSKDPEAAKPYGIRLIPTQIFLGPDSRELFRHEGFFGKQEILSKWKELGFSFESDTEQAEPSA